MGKEYSFYGKEYADGCPGCNRIEPQPLALQIVYETNSFRVHQDYALPIPGMMVIETKRHVSKPDELTPEEQQEFGVVWAKVSDAIRETLGIEEITHVLQDKSTHFHLWLLPVHPWMKDAADGKLRNLQDIFGFAKENMMTEEYFLEVEKVTEKIKNHLCK